MNSFLMAHQYTRGYFSVKHLTMKVKVREIKLAWAKVKHTKTLGHFTFWLRPWLSLLAQTKH